MNCIFLDIDGVLNNDKTTAKSPNGFVGLSDSLCKRLKHLKKDTSAIIILISSWKDADKEDKDYLMRKLRKYECTPLGRTFDRDDNVALRGLGIKKYVENNEIDNYVILDDCLYDYKDHPDIMQHLVQTDFHIGLTDEDCENAKKVLQKDFFEQKVIEEWNYHR